MSLSLPLTVSFGMSCIIFFVLSARSGPPSQSKPMPQICSLSPFAYLYLFLLGSDSFCTYMQRYTDGHQEEETDNTEDVIIGGPTQTDYIQQKTKSQLGNEEYNERELVGLTF